MKHSFFQRTPLFQKSAETDESGLSALRPYLDWLGDTKVQYDSRNIPAEYFWDSISDLAIWCEDFGTAGFQEWEWVGYSLRLEVICIGRFQFEPSILRQQVTLDCSSYPVEMSVLNVHIPAGEPIRQETVLASMQQEPDFLDAIFTESFQFGTAIHGFCLPPFRSCFRPISNPAIPEPIYPVQKVEQELQAEERVFGFLSENIHAYPENTSLQRAIKVYLLAGKVVPMGGGGGAGSMRMRPSIL